MWLFIMEIIYTNIMFLAINMSFKLSKLAEMLINIKLSIYRCKDYFEIINK
jgi:hypothetical protein